jgi:putative membrane protein
MRQLLKKLITSTLSLYITTSVLPQFSLPQAPQEFITLALIFMLAQLIIKPVVKMLLLPLTVLTFGLVGAFADVIVLYVLDTMLPAMSVGTITLNILNTNLVFRGVLAYIAVAFTLQCIHGLLKWIIKE